MENLTKFIEVYNKGTKSLPEIIQELKSTNSKIEKESILNREFVTDNQELRQILYWCYSPDINFYTTKIPEYINSREIYSAVASVQQIVEKVCSRELTGYAALEYISFILSMTTKEDVEIVKSVIKRDLDCGVQETTINKIWKGLINDPPYMSYSLFSKKLINNLKLPCYSDIKMDGLYADVTITENNISYTSRAGKTLKFKLPYIIESELQHYAKGKVLHAEALVFKDNSKTEFEPREIGNGYLNSDNVDPDRVGLVVWDAVTIDEYKQRKSNMIYQHRSEVVSGIINNIKSPHVVSVESVYCQTIDDVINHFISARSRGLEGTVVKSPNMLWVDKKVKDGIKIKNQFDCEYRIVGFQDHSKKEGQIGAIFVESEDSKIKFKVGSGLTDAQRKSFYKQKESMIGKIATIRGNDIVSSETKETFAIFLPRFIEIREDKTVADTYEKVLESRDSIIDLLKMIGVKK